MVSTVEDRKDLAQDIYLKTFHNLGGFKFQSKLSTWIARIADTCLSWIEKKKLVFPGNLGDDENEDLPLKSVYHHSYQDSESIISRKELSGILTKEIEDLPAIYKTLITLFHHGSMTYEELSQVTGLPEGTVKSSLVRARKMLKEKLLSKYQKEAL